MNNKFNTSVLANYNIYHSSWKIHNKLKPSSKCIRLSKNTLVINNLWESKTTVLPINYAIWRRWCNSTGVDPWRGALGILEHCSMEVMHHLDLMMLLLINFNKCSESGHIYNLNLVPSRPISKLIQVRRSQSWRISTFRTTQWRGKKDQSTNLLLKLERKWEGQLDHGQAREIQIRLIIDLPLKDSLDWLKPILIYL